MYFLFIASLFFVTSNAVEWCANIDSFSSLDFVSITQDFISGKQPTLTNGVTCLDCRNTCSSTETCVAYSSIGNNCYHYHNTTTLESLTYFGIPTTNITSGIIYSKIPPNGFTLTSSKIINSPYRASYADNNAARCRSLCLKSVNCVAYQQPTCIISTIIGTDQFEIDNDDLETVYLVGPNALDAPDYKNIDDIKETLPDLTWGASHSKSKLYTKTTDVVYYISAPSSNTIFYSLTSLDLNALNSTSAFDDLIVNAHATPLNYVINSFDLPAAVLRKYDDVYDIYELDKYEFTMTVSQCADVFKFELMDGTVKPEYGKLTVLSDNVDTAVCTATDLTAEFIEFNMSVCNIEFMIPKLYAYQTDTALVGMATVYNVTCYPDYISVDVEETMADVITETDYIYSVHESIFDIDLKVLDVNNQSIVGYPTPGQKLKLIANMTDAYRAEFDLQILQCYVNGYLFYDERPLNELTDIARDIDTASQYINFSLFFPPSNQITNSLTYTCAVSTCWQSCDLYNRKRRSINGKEYRNRQQRLVSVKILTKFFS